MTKGAEGKIINTWDQLVAFGGDRIAICYEAQDLGRGGRPAAFLVMRILNGVEIKTDPEAPWHLYGRRTFYIRFPIVANRPKALAKAKAWANKMYGVRTYVRNRCGDYVEAEVNARFPIMSNRGRVGRVKASE